MSVERESLKIECEGLTHNCAIAAFWFKEPASNIDPLLLPMVRLQHRGQEGTGIATVFNNGQVDSIIESGHVREIFSGETPAMIRARKIRDAKILIGHNRYSTSGDRNAWQPFVGDDLILAHNGNLTNPRQLLIDLPPDLQTQAKSDTWILYQAIRYAKGKNMEEKIVETVAKTNGAFSLVIADPQEKSLYGIRDPWGFRPLYLGKLNNNNGYMMASETIAFQRLCSEITEIAPGQGLKIENGQVSKFYQDARKVIPASCIFELIYFSSPASEVFGINADRFRNECGRALAREDLEKGFIPNVIIPVQNSGVAPAHGYVQKTIKHHVDKGTSGSQIAELTSKSGLLTNQYIGRIFIEPGERSERLRHKFVVNEEMVKDTVVVVIDDSIIRGDTTKAIVEILKEAGAKEVHFRIASPPARYPCFMGIDFPTNAELIAHGKEIDEIRMAIGADSLNYLSIEEMMAIARKLNPEAGFCNACFSGQYPLEIDPELLFSKK